MIEKFRSRIESMGDDVTEVETQEREEREMRACQNQVNKAERLMSEDAPVVHKREWFQSHKERKQEKGEMMSRANVQ